MKLCCWSGKRCYRSQCEVFDCSSGNVSVCPYHGNPDGHFLPKKFVGSHLSLIQIWALAGKRKGGVFID